MEIKFNNLYLAGSLSDGTNSITIANLIAKTNIYNHNMSINGTNSSGFKITARLIGTSRSNILANNYSQVVNMMTGSVNYPASGYVYNSDDTLLGTIVYIDYNLGNYFEFTVVTPTGIEVIDLTTSQANISDIIVAVE